MKTVALAEAKDHLSSLIDEVEHEHEFIRVTRHGRPAAVLVSEYDLDAMRETIFWLSQDGIADDIAEAREASVSGATQSSDQVRARYGKPSP